MLVAVALAACGGGSGNLTIVGSSPTTIGVGPQRLVMAEVDPETSAFVGGPDELVTIDFTGPDGEIQTVPAEWVWSIDGVRGFLIARADFDQPGQWQAVITSPRGASDPTAIIVNERVSIPEVGDPVPRSETPTFPDHPLKAITTDPDPDPSFYQLTVAEAVSNGTPSLIVFATPAFCQTATCGPTMDRVKEAVASRAGLDVVHVEIYENIDSDGAGELVEAPTVTEWGLPSEPWIYVVDEAGAVAARFEGVVSTSELAAALDAVIGG
jgi:hypothetical protein